MAGCFALALLHSSHRCSLMKNQQKLNQHQSLLTRASELAPRGIPVEVEAEKVESSVDYPVEAEMVVEAEEVDCN